MDRRGALRATTVWLAAPAATAQLAGCSGRLKGFSDWRDAQEAVLDLQFKPRVVQGSTWSLSQVLQHLAQSIEFSMQGYPALKGAWFRSTIGSAAFMAFNAQGAMSHDLGEPIPGAPVLDASVALKDAVNRLLAAMDGFAAFDGTLRPHFAYGRLTKPQYERAHLMHLAQHWTQFQAPSPRSPS